MNPAPPDVVSAYTALLEQAILTLRMRIRYGGEISIDEVHDYLDALHNVPIMLRNYGGWHVEENINADLAGYDQKWPQQPNSTGPRSLVDMLRRCREGEFDYPD
jgi:hypothetical protein